MPLYSPLSIAALFLYASMEIKFTREINKVHLNAFRYWTVPSGLRGFQFLSKFFLNHVGMKKDFLSGGLW